MPDDDIQCVDSDYDDDDEEYNGMANLLDIYDTENDQFIQDMIYLNNLSSNI